MSESVTAAVNGDAGAGYMNELPEGGHESNGNGGILAENPRHAETVLDE